MSEEPFLDRIVADDRAALLSLGRRNEYPRGQVLFFEGDPGHDVLLLLEGQVKVSMTSRS
ncbi:MAG: Crp/Fnr family transcriptional regulator, partial [Actinobacteria bacterium]|nr:Crp/Fnr family transcriptional regulator [Actinomycetota bacterium]